MWLQNFTGRFSLLHRLYYYILFFKNSGIQVAKMEGKELLDTLNSKWGERFPRLVRLQFSDWYLWKKRREIAHLNYRGVYIIAKFDNFARCQKAGGQFIVMIRKGGPYRHLGIITARSKLRSADNA